jgi:uncharacterized membrane protein
MDVGVIFEHAVPAGILWLGWGVAVALVALSAWRHLRRERTGPWLLLLRLLFLLLLGWTMALPSRRAAISEKISPRFLVLLDTSASMARGMEDGLAATNRWGVAMAMLGEGWGEAVAAAGCDVSLAAFSAGLSDARPLAPGAAGAFQPDGGSTRLLDALDALFARHRGQDIAGVLLLSDGLDSSSPAPGWTASRTWPAPVHTVVLGVDAPREIQPDVRVEAIDTPRRAVVGWETRLSATVAGRADGGEPFVVRLLRDGALVGEAPARLPEEGGSQELSFQLPHDAIGTETWRVEIPPLPRESATNDNALAVAVEVVDARNRLLYLEGVPRWESKYLNRELLANKDITPLCFIRGPGGEFLSHTQSAGAGELDLTDTQLARYKIVILGDLDAAALGPARAEALRAFVERGGSLVLLGGPKTLGPGGLSTSPLSALMPFSRSPSPPVEGKFPARWSADGLAHPALAGAGESLPADVPPVLSVYADAAPGAASLTLAEAETPAGWQPLVVTRPYGQGKVVALLTDSLWRWRLEPGSREAYSFLWKRLVEWLSPEASAPGGHSVELLGAARRVEAGEEIELTARILMADGSTPPPGLRVECGMRLADGRETPLAMEPSVVRAAGREFPGFLLRFTPPVAGGYRAIARVEIAGETVSSPPLLFHAREAASETAPLPIDLETLRAISRASGGRHGSPEEIADALRSDRYEARRLTRVQYSSLWQKPALLALLLLLLATEWIARKLRGLA